MAKKTKKRVQKKKELTRKQRSHLERENRLEKILIWSVTAVAVLIVGVLAYGLIVEKFINAREPVAIVGGTPIRTAEFQARVRFTRMQIQSELQYWFQQQQILDPTDPNTQFYLEYIQGNIRDLQTRLSPSGVLAIGEQALDQLIQEELVRQEVERRGIAVTPEEVQQEIEQFFGYDRNPATPTPVPTATPPLTPTDVLTPAPTAVPLPTAVPVTEQDFNQRYDAYLKESLKPLDISDQQYRSWIEASLLIGKLQEQMNAELPETADQVNLRYLTVDSEERVEALAVRWDAGEDFQTLVDELGADEEVAGYGSELGWSPRSILERYFDAELVDLAFGMEIEERSQPVLGQGGEYTIIEVVGHEVRELEPSLREQLGEEAFREWLDAQQVLVERRTYDDRVPAEP